MGEVIAGEASKTGGATLWVLCFVQAFVSPLVRAIGKLRSVCISSSLSHRTWFTFALTLLCKYKRLDPSLLLFFTSHYLLSSSLRPRISSPGTANLVETQTLETRTPQSRRKLAIRQSGRFLPRKTNPESLTRHYVVARGIHGNERHGAYSQDTQRRRCVQCLHPQWHLSAAPMPPNHPLQNHRLTLRVPRNRKHARQSRNLREPPREARS